MSWIIDEIAMWLTMNATGTDLHEPVHGIMKFMEAMRYYAYYQDLIPKAAIMTIVVIGLAVVSFISINKWFKQYEESQNKEVIEA